MQYLHFQVHYSAGVAVPCAEKDEKSSEFATQADVSATFDRRLVARLGAVAIVKKRVTS